MTRRTVLAALGAAGAFAAPSPRSPVSLDDLRKTVPTLGAASRERLLSLMNAADFRGRLPAAEVERIAAEGRTTIDRLMIDLLPLAQLYSRPPLSNFRVGAVVRGAGGDLYLGANLEVPGNSLGLSVHAEQASTSNAFMTGDRGITALAVTAAPCGHCRQFLYELSGGREMPILVKNIEPTRLSALLPLPFGPKDLGLSGEPFAHKQNPLRLNGQEADRPAVRALEAARGSYAPYSKSPSGVAVGSKSGRIYTGSYLENAAFNPSLSPFQIALIGMIMARDPFENIDSVTLVELTHAAISQQDVTRAVMRSFSIRADLRVLRAAV